MLPAVLFIQRFFFNPICPAHSPAYITSFPVLRRVIRFNVETRFFVVLYAAMAKCPLFFHWTILSVSPKIKRGCSMLTGSYAAEIE